MGLAERSVSEEVIQPGDLLEVTMLSDYAKLTMTTTPIRVGDDGAVVVPLIGRVNVAGLSVQQAEQAVNSESVLRGVFRTPCITLNMKQVRTNRISVVGAVNEPGPHELPRGSSSLMAALVAAEGLTKEAGTEVEIRHVDSRQQVAGGLPPGAHGLAQTGAERDGAAGGLQADPPTAAGPTVTVVNLLEATIGRQRVPELVDGDVVYVAERMLRPIYVIGLVRKPGEFPYPTTQELRVVDALALAGGASNPVAEDIMVIRQLPNQKEPVRIAVSLQGAKNGRDNVALAPGDTVSVEQTPMTVAVDVITTFFRFGFSGGIPGF